MNNSPKPGASSYLPRAPATIRPGPGTGSSKPSTSSAASLNCRSQRDSTCDVPRSLQRRSELILGKSLFGNVFLDQSNLDPSLCHPLQYVSVFFLLRLTGPSRAVAGVLSIFLR